MVHQKNTVGATFSKFSLQVSTMALLVNLFVVGLVVLILNQSYIQYQKAAESNTRNLAHVLEENFSGTLNQIDIAMLAVRDEVTRQYAGGKLNDVTLNNLMTRQQQRLEAVDALRITDEQGIVRYGSGVQPQTRVDLSDRDYFIYFKTHDDGRVLISAPIFARINHKWELPVARRFNHPDGSFAGMVYALISLEKIRQFFFRLDVGEHGIVNLRDGDMNIIVRYPEPKYTATSIGKNTMTPELRALLKTGNETGTYRVKGVLDNLERTFSYRKVEGQSLYITVGFAVDDYLQEWQDFEYKLILLVIFFILVTSYAAYLVIRGEKRRSEVAVSLQSLNRDFLKLLENTTDFIYFKDKDSRIRFCSQTLARITGHGSWRDLIGKHDFEIFPEETARIYNEEELPIFRDGVALLNRVDPYYDEQGRQGWVSTNKWPLFDDNGKTVIGIFGISRDITQHKKDENALKDSDARWRDSILNSPIPIMIHAEDSEVLMLSKAWTDITGYDLKDIPTTKIWSDKAYGHQAEEIEGYIEKLYGLQEVRREGVYTVRSATGETRLWDFQSQPLRKLPDGRRVVLSQATDITERKMAEDALRRSNADLERFAYSVSHDMRQPLRAISGHLQLLKQSLKDKLDENERENLAFALDGALRMDSMIVSLLDYSRVGRKTDAKQWTPSRAVLDDALAFLNPMIRESKTEVRTAGDWPQVFASRDELTRLLQNLIGNAVKFRVQGQSALVEVESSTAGGQWRVAVHDHGVGIEPGQMGRLFQFFSRLQSRAHFDGTGMGLALCRRIVEHHHGRIWVESEGVGKGSSFIFEFPLQQDDPGQRETVRTTGKGTD